MQYQAIPYNNIIISSHDITCHIMPYLLGCLWIASLNVLSFVLTFWHVLRWASREECSSPYMPMLSETTSPQARLLRSCWSIAFLWAACAWCTLYWALCAHLSNRRRAKRNQHLITENKGCGCSFHTVLPIPIKSNFVTWTYCNSFTGRFMLVAGHDRFNMMYKKYIFIYYL